MWLMILLLIIHQTSGVSYNQPKLCPDATWNPNATTIANNSTISAQAYDVFVNTNNTIYLADYGSHQILSLLQDSLRFNKINLTGLYYPYSLFVTSNGDLYVDNGNNYGRVDKWTSNSTPVMYVSSGCTGLFMDINDNLYCSMHFLHQVVMTPQNNPVNMTTLVAGTGCAGSSSNMLNYPWGIFIDINLSLYVADSSNNRIQLFLSGQLNGTTVNISISLRWPTDVVLDADGYLFITDCNNSRIVGSGPNGFRCIVGCSGSSGSKPNQLSSPISLSFDSDGNIVVTDTANSRIQKFILALNSCNATMTTTATTTTKRTITSTAQTMKTSTKPSTPVAVSNGNKNPSSADVSYNQPKFCASATWNPNGRTFRTLQMNKSYPFTIFVDPNNYVYVPDTFNTQILRWLGGSSSGIYTIIGDSSSPYSLFVRTNGDIYVDYGAPDNGVYQWESNSLGLTPVMHVKAPCFGLFLDIKNNVYCSMNALHQVVMKSNNMQTAVAGTGCPGISPQMLHFPSGIFVDSNFNLYVADGGNNRIQFFPFGQLSGTTVAGNGVSGSIVLSWPTSVVLDADGYLFIADRDNNRIVGSGSNGFRCVVGCSGSSGSALNQLSSPLSLGFDSDGNILVTDAGNNRILIFVFENKSCEPSMTSQRTTRPTVHTTTNSTKTIPSTKMSTSHSITKNSKIPYSTASRSTMSSTIIHHLTSFFSTTNVPNRSPSTHTSRASTIATLTANQTITSTATVHRSSITSRKPTELLLTTSSTASANTSITNVNSMLSLSTAIRSTIRSTPALQATSLTTSTETMTTSVKSSSFVHSSIPLTSSPRNLATLVTTVVNIVNMSQETSTLLHSTKPSILSTVHQSISSASEGWTQISSSTTTTTTKITSIRSVTNQSNIISISSTIQAITNTPSATSFFPPHCANRTQMGLTCNTSAAPCEMLQPCRHNGRCHNTNTTSHGYNCSCVSGFDGINCDFDQRLCQVDTCWNGGVCNETSSSTFTCACQLGWTGVHCEEVVDQCHEVQCLNNGVCHPLFLNFTCECLGTSYSGRHCEIMSRKVVIYQIVSKSTASVAIVALSAVVLFVIVMDVLKYFFKVDPAKSQRDRARKKKRAKKVKRHPVVLRYIYVHQSVPTIVVHPTVTVE